MIAVLRANCGLVAVGLLGVALLIALPLALDLFDLLQITLYAIFAILALSLAFIWGYGGILCFGHSAFFGLGAYSYAVAVINIGESTAPSCSRCCCRQLLAAALGYFMFYARISDIYVGVITLTLTLNLLQLHQLHRRSGLSHRRSVLGRLQRHAEYPIAQYSLPARRDARACSACSSSAADCADRLFCLACAARQRDSDGYWSPFARTSSASNFSATMRGCTSSLPLPSAAPSRASPDVFMSRGVIMSARRF